MWIFANTIYFFIYMYRLHLFRNKLIVFFLNRIARGCLISDVHDSQLPWRLWVRNLDFVRFFRAHIRFSRFSLEFVSSYIHMSSRLLESTNIRCCEGLFDVIDLNDWFISISITIYLIVMSFDDSQIWRKKYGTGFNEKKTSDI